MKRTPLAVLAGLVLSTPVWAQSHAGAKRDMDIVELRLRVQALEAQVERLTTLLREHVAADSRATRPEPASGPAGEPAIPRVAAEGELPTAQQMPGYPWLRVEDGVLYLQPVPISAELASLLSQPQGWASLFEGLDIAWEGDLLRVVDLSPRHLLARHLGVRPGDRLVTLNEHLLPRTAPDRAALADALRGRRRFALELLRGKRRVIVAFYVAPGTPEPAPLEPVAPELEQRYRLVVASQDPNKPGGNSVVLQHADGKQITVFVGDPLDGMRVESIAIEREGDETRATLMLGGEDAQRVLRLKRTP